jgi:protein-disulfide isomerase
LRTKEGTNIMRKIGFLGLSALALALSLSACNKGDENGTVKGDVAAKVAAPAGKTWSDVVAKTEAGGYLIGNPAAAVKLVEFGSLTCSHCAEFSAESGEELREKYINTGQVSYEMRNFIRDQFDLIAARLTHCAANESYWALTEQFFGFQPNLFENDKKVSAEQKAAIQKLPQAEQSFAIAEAYGIIEFFAQRGVSRDQAKTCLADTAAMEKMAKITGDAAKEYEITGTPTFLLNGSKFELAVGTSGWGQTKGRLQEAGAR